MATEYLSCTRCAVEVRRKPTRGRDGKPCTRIFCSKVCYDATRVEERGVCDHCQRPLRPGKLKSRFCDQSCRVAALKPAPVNCVACGTLFCAVKPIKRLHGIEMTAHSSGKTCSRACQLNWIRINPEWKRKISKAMSGGKHPLWQGGKAQIRDASSRGLGWKVIRAKVLARDKVCVDCGIDRVTCKERYRRDLDADHIEPFHNFTSHKEANRMSNLQARCASCHRVAEAKRGGIQALLPFGSDPGHNSGGVWGERVNTAKLTIADVIIIRRRYDAGARGSDLAKEYGITPSGISAVVTGKSWKRVPAH